MISGVSKIMYQMGRVVHQGQLTELSKTQKQVWRDFISINRPDISETQKEVQEDFISINRPDIVEERIPEIRLDRNLHWKCPAGVGDLGEDRERNEQIVQTKGRGLEQARYSLRENILSQASELLSKDSPISSDWLRQHLGVAKLITTYPEFAKHLNNNPDLAQNFMYSPDEVKTILKDFFDEKAIQKASEILSDDSPITREWLEKNLSAVRFLAKHPNFTVYLGQNPEQAEKFINISA